MIKQASAVMTLLKELVGLETVVGSSIVKNVKKGCMKAAGDRETKKGKRENCDDIGPCDVVNWQILQETCKESETGKQGIFATTVADVLWDEDI